MQDDASNQALLILEKLDHFRSQINARFDRVESELQHQSELDRVRHANLEKSIEQLTATLADHETRIRTVSDSATRFNFLVGGAGLSSLFAVIRSFFP